jgi:hypothetical protein
MKDIPTKLKWFLFGIAVVLQLGQLGAAQKKEEPNLTPIVVPNPDAQKKEAPNASVFSVIRGWLIAVVSDAQKKE